MRRDSVLGTFLVAAILCIACSVLVSAAAVGLRGLQVANKDLFQKKNILIAAGVMKPDERLSKEEVAERFKRFETWVVDLETGQLVGPDVVDPATFDQRASAKEADMSTAIDADRDLAGIRRREKYAKVYAVREGDEVKTLVLPVYGKGLWSTLYGFLALEGDLNTVKGLTFYEHKETPGLGGEVDNPSWKAKWPGTKLRDESGELRVEVVKGSVAEGSAAADYQVDGLSGATITSRGVSNLLRYWLSPDAFGPFLEKLQATPEQFSMVEDLNRG